MTTTTTTPTYPTTHGLAVAVAVRLAQGWSERRAIRDAAQLNKTTRRRVRAACRMTAAATCDPYLERLGAQYLPAAVIRPTDRRR